MTILRCTRFAVALTLGTSIALTGHADSIAKLTLDSLSFVSFQDEEVLPIDAGAELIFRFHGSSAPGTIDFTIAPEDVAIPPVALGSDSMLKYSLAGVASGTMKSTTDGRRITFSATISASIDGGEPLLYSMPFTTETASSTNRLGDVTVEITGLRLIEGVWYVQLVGATVNKSNAFPKPGSAVYIVLSGTFDQLPDF